MKHLDLKGFEKKIAVRQIKLLDYAEIAAMKLKCFPGMKRWSKEHLN